MSVQAQIVSLGQRGDGLAETDGGKVHVPGALPGETVEIEIFGSEAHLLSVITPSPERIKPFCPHFGVCGGCRMQHVGPVLYQSWKRESVVAAVGRADAQTPVAPLVPAQGIGRRRVTMHVRFERGKPVAGFMAARTHDIVDLTICPVLAPALINAADLARAVARPFGGFGKPLDIQMTTSDAGIDVDVRGSGKIEPEFRLALTNLAARLDLARLSLHGDIIVERRAPLLRMGRASVNPPPGGFLQATAAGEEALAALVSAAVGTAKRVGDLFCGVGPFALRLAEACAITAVDSDKPAIEALKRAAHNTPGLKALTAEARDLFRRPLLIHELKVLDAVVLDPPRAGAEAQVRQLALAKCVPVIAYVSCDPQSFSRDAALLIEAGYKLESVTPVDQFTWSTHVELVGVFRLPPPPRKKGR